VLQGKEASFVDQENKLPQTSIGEINHMPQGFQTQQAFLPSKKSKIVQKDLMRRNS
jgi:hypothetical protein